MTPEYMAHLSALEQQYGLPRGILAAQQQTESNFNPAAVSPAGAQGIAQFMPATAKQYGIDPLDPMQASDGEARMMADLSRKYGGDMKSALAAYNWGQGNVDRKGLTNAPPETQNYVAKVTGALQQFAGAVGDTIIPPAEAADSDPFASMSDKDLLAEAQKMGISPPAQAAAKPDSSDPYASMSDEQLLAEAKKEGIAPQSPSFLQQMGANFDNAVQSARDIGSGNFEDIGRTVSTPKTQALADNLFPAGSDGSLMGALGSLRNTSPSDWSGALLEKMNDTPEGKALSVMGGLNPVWNAASTALSQYGNPAIEKATGIAPDNLALLETALPALGIKKAADVSDPSIKLLQKASDAVGNSGAPKPGRPAIPTADDLRSQSSALFKQADQMGGTLKPHITDAWIDEASKILPQTAAGKLVVGETATTQLIDRLQGLRGKPMTLAESQEINSALGEMAQKEVDPKTGKYNAEGKKLLGIQGSLRDAVDNATHSDTVGGKAGFDILNKARPLWAASARMGDVERIIARADGRDNPTTIIKNGFSALANNQKRFKAYSPAEKAAIKKASKTGIVGGAIRLAGSRLTPWGAGAAGSVGGAAGTALGAAAGFGISEAARALSTHMQLRRAESAKAAIAKRAISPAPSKSKLPAIASGTVKSLPNSTKSAAYGGSIAQGQPTKITIQKRKGE